MAQPAEKNDESRRALRQRVLLSGKLVYGPWDMTLDCAVSDLSSSGARVRLQGPELLNDPIYLIIVRQGVAFLAREAWRDGAVVGLAFSDKYELAKAPQELPGLVRQIWVE